MSSDTTGPTLIAAAEEFSRAFCAVPHPDLLGVKDSKRVGGYVESAFKRHLVTQGLIEANEGNAALGLDLPSWNTDIKSTSARQPQSSAPFRSLKQRIEGLGHSLLVFVYERRDDEQGAWFRFAKIRFVPAALTGDRKTTRQLRELIAGGGGEDAVYGYLLALGAEQELAVDEEGLRAYARQLIAAPPIEGCLTISPAWQWRLQYGHALDAAGVLGGDLDDAG